eukprot:CAMPEP_0177570738 /NCGR_PEP_ID=MMETSP0369-20130122/77020_1 /TAXON_ID=447022 ORGANISM="Scrippsiella hangoei-like, Strain SHHI-4" /NCGR_SAMPLE_ID=MMETSP0369 /ASSEMBLY_ACC=CAM_ASM_000364 /LENGTH=35 /DNA_ID= /DNA_START= /DNA_END= /DNA_ORIENTATION=
MAATRITAAAKQKAHAWPMISNISKLISLGDRMLR